MVTPVHKFSLDSPLPLFKGEVGWGLFAMNIKPHPNPPLEKGRELIALRK